jgi:hypothetical protein
MHTRDQSHVVHIVALRWLKSLAISTSEQHEHVYGFVRFVRSALTHAIWKVTANRLGAEAVSAQLQSSIWNYDYCPGIFSVTLRISA